MKKLIQIITYNHSNLRKYITPYLIFLIPTMNIIYLDPRIQLAIYVLIDTHQFVIHSSFIQTIAHDQRI